MPGGHFLAWQPGKIPAKVADGLAWVLEPETDLILQLHMNPTGKPEKIQPSVALYFTPRAPTNTLFKMQLASMTLDIPAGTSNYVAKDSFVLPTDAFAIGVLPHAHYLAKEMRGFATLPNGAKKWLIWIRDWNFAWQGDYQYAEPVFLPKGSRLEMEYGYDNSTNNVRNPNHPPQTVRYGAASSGEMAELWLQLLVPDTNQIAALSAAYDAKMLRLFTEHYAFALRLDPNDAAAHLGLGKTMLGTGKLSEGLSHLRAAARLKPNDPDGHYTLGLTYLQSGRPAYAKLEFERTVQLDSTHFKALTYLGILAFQAGKLEEAEAKFRESLRIDPSDAVARENLDLVRKARKG
jgi:tetratricopeptide (TPR) repeat protein